MTFWQCVRENSLPLSNSSVHLHYKFKEPVRIRQSNRYNCAGTKYEIWIYIVEKSYLWFHSFTLLTDVCMIASCPRMRHENIEKAFGLRKKWLYNHNHTRKQIPLPSTSLSYEKDLYETKTNNLPMLGSVSVGQKTMKSTKANCTKKKQQRMITNNNSTTSHWILFSSALVILLSSLPNL